MEVAKSEEKRYGITVFSCFAGYVVQAVINNFAPLLFLTFQASYGIPLSRITLLITVNFVVQLLVDLVSAKFADKIGYKPCVIVAQIFAAAGLVGMTVLPEIMNAYAGLMISVVTYAVGGGLLEVLVSPIVESCPGEHKEKRMSLLHSFYCWGHVGVVLASTLFFATAGIGRWKILALLWALLPVADAILFAFSPIAPLMDEGEKGCTVKELFKNKTFLLLLVMMICAGASEQAVSQWASLFAERGLGVSKTLGDLFGPTLFAVCMGLSRLIFGKFGHKMKLERFMFVSGVVCVSAYLCVSLVPSAAVNLAACGVCGFAVGIMWPGTFSVASGAIRRGGTLMFALLALGGDVGCAAGPTLAGCVSTLAGSMKIGILSAVIFPVTITLVLIFAFGSHKKKEQR